jgi:DNA-binding CsgD family transcriptional regulator
MSAQESMGGAVRALAAFVHDVHERILGGDPRAQLLGTARDASSALRDIAEETSSTLWNVQPRLTVRGVRETRALDDHSTARGVAMRFVTSSAALHQFPLLSSHVPFVRVAPVTQAMLVADARVVVVAGPPGTSEEPTIWATAEPRVVARAMRVYDDLWRSARPGVPECEEPPFTPRMVELSFLLIDGATDRQIARRLNVSERTVSNEVRELVNRLGATSRIHAIAMLAGANA